MTHGWVAGVRRIAVLRAGALGDFIFTLPALDALRAAYPDAEIVLLCKPWTVELLRDRPGPVSRAVAVPVVRGVGAPQEAVEDAAETEAFFSRMRAERFDIALQLHGGGRHSNPLLTHLRPRISAGLRADDAPPLDRTMPYLYYQNERLRLLEAVALVGAAPRSLAPTLHVTRRDLDEAESAVPGAARPLVMIQPGAADPRRRWPPAKFAALADALAAEGVCIAINGTREERDLVAEVLHGMRGPALDLAGRLSVGGLAGLMSRARLVVSNDTGPLYLAEAVGAPTVGIHWLTNLAISGALFKARHRYAVSMRVECPTCGKPNLARRCAHDPSFVADVAVDEVLAPARALLRAGDASMVRVRRPALA